MPGYAWVNHSWLFDPLLYVIYTRFSFIGLSIAGALASVLTFYLSVRRAHLTYWQTAILAVFYAALTKDIIMQGLRSQVIGLPLLALLGELLARQRAGRDWPHWVLPGLFCFWANLHGSFLLGLVVFGTYVAWDAVLAQVLERACRIQILAESTGTPYHVSNSTDVKAKQDYVYSTLSLKSYWEYCVRLVKQTAKETREW